MENCKPLLGQERNRWNCRAGSDETKGCRDDDSTLGVKSEREWSWGLLRKVVGGRRREQVRRSDRDGEMGSVSRARE